jgi:hypothetical protein
VTATAPTATDMSAMVAALLVIEYRVAFVPSSTCASSVNHTLPGYDISHRHTREIFDIDPEW